MKKFIFTLVALCSFLLSYGQALDVTHFMRISPFQHNDLPSSSTIYNGYFSLPTGNIHAGLNLGAIRYSNLFETNAEGYPTVLTATRFVNSLSDNNYLGLDLNMELLGLGFRIKEKSFMSIDYRLRGNVDLKYSRDVLGLPIYGNMAYVDEPADLNLDLNVNLFQEIGISFRNEINKWISWGVRPKMLFGLANLNTECFSAQVYTDPTDYTITMNYEAAMRAAAIVPFTMTFNQQDGFQFDYERDLRTIGKNAFKNYGFGVDFGITINPIKPLSISAAVLDLGFINWKTSTVSLTSALNDAGGLYNEGSLTFSGLTQEQIQALINGENISQMLDTLALYFPLEIAPTGSYKTSLNTRFVVQADLEFLKHHRVSAAAQFWKGSNYFQPSFTIAYDGCFFNVLDLCVAYTMQRKSMDNLGVGVGINLGILNIYAGTQNIIAAFKIQNASLLTATAGVVFNWGHIKNWKAKNTKDSSSNDSSSKEGKSEKEDKKSKNEK